MLKHTTTTVDELPTCDFCGSEAYADGRTTLGSWAYMCLKDFSKYGVGLGTGKGQLLILRSKEDEDGH